MGEPGDQERADEDADRLADHQAEHDADHHRVAEQVGARRRATTPADSRAKNGTATARRDRRQQVLEVLRRAAPPRPGRAARASAGRAPCRRWWRGRRSRARTTRRRRPAAGRRPASHPDVAGARPGTRTPRARRRPGPARCSVVGVEDGDDHDHEQVVDDGERQQERPQRGRQVRPDDRQHRQGERDVGRRRDRPALGPPVRRDAVDERGRSLPVRRPRTAAATTGTAASAGRRSEPTTNSRLSSSPATKKNSVSAPSAAQCSRSSGPTSKCAQRVVRRAPGRVRPDDRDRGGQRARSPRRRSRGEQVAEEGALGRRRVGEEQALRAGRARHGQLSDGYGDVALPPTCRPDFPAHHWRCYQRGSGRASCRVSTGTARPAEDDTAHGNRTGPGDRPAPRTSPPSAAWSPTPAATSPA